MTAFVWRESIYKNNFLCTCGAKLYDIEADKPTDNLGVASNHPDRCYCMRCKMPVAVIKDYFGEVNSSLMGRWKDGKTI